MKLGRRQFVGALAGAAASAVFPRNAAQAIAPTTITLPDPAAPGIARPWGIGPLAETAPVVSGPALLSRALAALQLHGGRVAFHDVIGIVDFSAPSKEARFTIYDVAANQVLSTHLVAHGKGSDPANSGWVETLSNQPGSNASCSGSFLTSDIYYGKHGRSRRLIGLDRENNCAEERAIVIHAASYVGPSIAQAQGRVGRSQGCFAVSSADILPVLTRLGPDRLLFAAR